MAKMFYSTEEVQEKLGVTEEALKQMVAEGKLREFRDGAKIMFKVDEVDNLSGGDEIQFSDEDISLEPEAPQEPLAGGTGDEVPLSGDSGIGPEGGSSIGLLPGDSADQINLDDTSDTAKDEKDDTVVTSHGVNVLDEAEEEELELADPLAQTQIAPDLDDQVHLDSGSSGSGLLDLTREADDTSLGAELLEEIYPGSDTEGQLETQLPTELDIDTGEKSVTASTTDTQLTAGPAMPDYTRAVEVYDPSSGAFGAALLIPLLALVYVGFVSATSMAGAQPPLLGLISDYVWYVVGGMAVLTGVILMVGMVMTQSVSKPKQPKAQKGAKAKKPKKEKKKKKGK